MENIKLNPGFKPSPVVDNDELFANGLFVFNISRLIAFINANQSKFCLEKVEVLSIRNLAAYNLDEATVKTANLSVPIILAEISPSMFNVIDGRHRLERAHRDNIDKISVYRVRAEQHRAFLTSTKAYNAYKEYWNNKIDDRCEEIQKRKFM